MQISYLSHFIATNGAGPAGYSRPARSMHHVMKAHGRGSARLREMGQRNCGIVSQLRHTRPASDSPADVAAADRWDGIMNRWFLEALAHGRYPKAVLDGLAPHMPKGWEDDMAEIARPIDWLGVNYYTRHFAAAAPRARPGPPSRCARAICPAPRWAGKSIPRG